MSKEYRKIRNIDLHDILNLEDGPFRDECIRRLIECGLIEEKQKCYKFGQRFLHFRDEYILAYLGNGTATLINTKSGWTWAGVKNIQGREYVTQEELNELYGETGHHNLTPIKNADER